MAREEDYTLSQNCSIAIGGEELSEYYMSLVDEIKHTDKAHGSDLVRITIVDSDYKFINDPMFMEEKKVHFEGGWEGDEIQFDGYISVIDVNFPQNGSPTVIVQCMDNTHLMNRKKKKRTWTDMKYSEVVEDIVKEYGFKTEIEETSEVKDNIAQSDKTDIAFIQEIADDMLEDDYLAYMLGDTFYFEKKKLLDTPQFEVYYREGDFSLISFNPRINKEIKKEQIEKSDINLKDKEVDKGEASNDSNIDSQGDKINTSSKKIKHEGGDDWSEVEE
jgi:phage protein D